MQLSSGILLMYSAEEIAFFLHLKPQSDHSGADAYHRCDMVHKICWDGVMPWLAVAPRLHTI